MTVGTAMQTHRTRTGLVANEVEFDAPKPGYVRVRVAAAGVCFADLATARRGEGRDGPTTPGHEIAGRIDAVGVGVRGWQVGDRAAVGWFGGSCRRCTACRSGDVVHCPDRRTPGVDYPGGWSELVTVPEDALARIPLGLADEDAAIMGCAGVTTFAALRDAGCVPGSRLGVLGLGGLGHLAVQFGAAMGLYVVVLARGGARASLAFDLGAHEYVDVDDPDAVASLRGERSLDHLMSTASSTSAIPGLLDAMRPQGRVTVLGVDDCSITISAGALVSRALTLAGHLTGGPLDIEAAMRFAHEQGIHAWTEPMPLTDANIALERISTGGVRFRCVLLPGAAA